MKQSIIDQVRDKSPFIFHLINQVVKNFVANGSLAFGASPAMTKTEESANDLAANADAVYINVGTLYKHDIPAMIIAGKVANKRGIPVVLDPVGIAASSFILEAVHTILKEVKPTVIKGNAGEIARLVDIPWEVKGVDSVGDGNVEEIAYQATKKYKTTIVATGKTDIICNENKIIHNKTGHPFLTKVTGGGCLLGSIIAACLTTDDMIEDQVVTAVSFYGLAAEYAASRKSVFGPGTFMPSFLDALSYDINQLKGRSN